MLLSSPMVLQLVWREHNNNTGVEQPWPQLIHCVSISCCICGCLFQSSRTLSEVGVNSGVKSYIAERKMLQEYRESGFNL